MSDQKDNMPAGWIKIRKGYFIRTETIIAIKFGGSGQRVRMIIYTNVPDNQTVDLDSIDDMKKVIKELNNRDIIMEFESIFKTSNTF